MKKITIIYGPKESGKSRLAQLFINPDSIVCKIDGRNANTNSIENRFFFSAVTPETNLIIIDDFPANYLSRLVINLYGNIRVEKRNAKTFVIERPEIIITVERSAIIKPPQKEIANRFNLIYLESMDDYYREAAKIRFHFEKVEPTTNIIINH